MLDSTKRHLDGSGELVYVFAWLQDDFSKSILVLPPTQEISGPESNGLLKEFEVLPGFGPSLEKAKLGPCPSDRLD